MPDFKIKSVNDLILVHKASDKNEEEKVPGIVRKHSNNDDMIEYLNMNSDLDLTIKQGELNTINKGPKRCSSPFYQVKNQEQLLLALPK